jgi:D-glycero-alpha-D-manno-heptose-7-phosphate kinase
MVITKTPFRISFFGGGTDYPAWFLQEGGAVISTTIDKYCHISLRHLPPFFENRHRIVWSHIELTDRLKAVQHPAIREVLPALGFDDSRGLELHHQGDLPARSGIGSSSSFVVGLLKAGLTLQGKHISKKELAAQAIRLEQEVMGENVGCQDQIAAAYGGLNYIEFKRDGSFAVETLALSPERKQELERSLHLVFTGFDRFATDIAADVIRGIPQNQATLRSLRRKVDLALEILTTSKDFREFGALLHQSWLEKVKLSSKIGNPLVHQIYEDGRAAGALGGKLLGAGGAGFMLFFVPATDRAQFVGRMKNYLQVPFCFETSGSTVQEFDPAS